jgi:hypothetical protein
MRVCACVQGSSSDSGRGPSSNEGSDHGFFDTGSCHNLFSYLLLFEGGREKEVDGEREPVCVCVRAHASSLYP